MSAGETTAGAVRQLTALLKLVRLHGGLENVVFAEQIPVLAEHLRAVFEHERAFHVETRETLVLANRRIVKGIGLGGNRFKQPIAALEHGGLEKGGLAAEVGINGLF